MANLTAAYLQNKLSGGAYNPSIGVYQPNVSTTTSAYKKTKTNPNTGKVTPVIKANTKNYQGASFDDLYNKYLNALGGGTGGASAGGKIDLTPYITSLKEGADANKKTLSDTYSSQRNQLSTKLRQQQENTETARKQLMDAFNSSRADLEEQAYMNNRAAQQSAAARGLGGSGLQQLAQLSSQIESSKQTSDLSKSNTEGQNTLTKELKDVTEEINNSINDLTTEERNKITEIDKNVAQAIADKQYEEEVRYQNALQQATATNASIAASAKQAAAQYAYENSDKLAQLNTSLQVNLEDAIENFDSVFKGKGSTTKKSQSLTDAYNNYKTLFQEGLSNSEGDQLSADYYNYYLSQLKNAYKRYVNNLPEKNKSFLWF